MALSKELWVAQWDIMPGEGAYCTRRTRFNAVRQENARPGGGDDVVTGQRMRAVVRYDGTGFAGWQVQPDARTIQGELERVLGQLAQQPVAVAGAGRTDAGVHAMGQVCHFDWEADMPPQRLRRAVSAMLSPEIRLETVETCAPDFHARYDARSKRYGYTLCRSGEPDPLAARYAWHVRPDLDFATLAQHAQQLTGTHDFAGYGCARADIGDARRTVFAIDLHPGPLIGPRDSDAFAHLVFHGEGFLYKMVRNMVGTLVDITRGQLDSAALLERLAAPGPYGGYTAPAHGLALIGVDYA